MSCFWRCRSLSCVATQHVNWQPFGTAEWLPSTVAVMRCSKCGDVRDRPLLGVGYLSPDQVNGSENSERKSR